MTFQPIGTQVLIEFEPNRPVNGIALPSEMETFDYSMFVVRGVGAGFLLTSGEYVPLPVMVGDRLQLLPTAKGNITQLPKHLCDDKNLGIVEVRHVAGIWQGEFPKPKFQSKVLAPSMRLVDA